jgi:hypothetical protein
LDFIVDFSLAHLFGVASCAWNVIDWVL